MHTLVRARRRSINQYAYSTYAYDESIYPYYPQLVCTLLLVVREYYSSQYAYELVHQGDFMISTNYYTSVQYAQSVWILWIWHNMHIMILWILLSQVVFTLESSSMHAVHNMHSSQIYSTSQYAQQLLQYAYSRVLILLQSQQYVCILRVTACGLQYARTSYQLVVCIQNSSRKPFLAIRVGVGLSVGEE